ncbi:hypothetical protein FD724_07320 [Nostoc sp. C057]|uniref:hypothetical protein n=1 Tax=Nostoc sp. C057 TaxID=2576903 RepID=UPI0015C39AE7|nr:hypothetical protein [Nostoc sp. C057]QLE47945.1 hypothetical protein FD724_07320 [Nostoc sp. C057]
MINYKQNLSIRLPDEWTQPKYYLGQLVKQGEIIGIRHLPENSGMAFDFGNEPWAYVVIKDKGSDSGYVIAQSEILPLAPEELLAKIQAEIEFHQNKIAALTQQLNQVEQP